MDHIDDDSITFNERQVVIAGYMKILLSDRMYFSAAHIIREIRRCFKYERRLVERDIWDINHKSRRNHKLMGGWVSVGTKGTGHSGFYFDSDDSKDRIALTPTQALQAFEVHHDNVKMLYTQIDSMRLVIHGWRHSGDASLKILSTKVLPLMDAVLVLVNESKK